MKLAALILALPLCAQVASFSPQPSPLPSLTYYSVHVCTSGPGVVLAGGKLYGAAQAYIVPVTRSGLLEAYRAAAHRSPWRYVAWGLEVAGGGLTLATQAKTNMIREKWKAGIPVVTAVIFTADKSVKAQVPAAAIPDNLVPALIQVPEHGCAAEITMAAKLQQDEKPFRTEVAP